MKGKKCPYCGRKISYLTVFHEKKHGVYECSRCKKESKVKIDKKLYILFGVLLAIILIYVILWRTSSLYNNIVGVIPPALMLIAFYFCTPFFINFVPLKRFLSYDDKKSEIETEEKEPEDKFVFDKKIFDEIKNKRNTRSSVEERIDRIIEEEKSYVPIIQDVSEAHTSSQSTLKKVNKTPPPESVIIEKEEEIKEYIPKKEKPNGDKYTANRML